MMWRVSIPLETCSSDVWDKVGLELPMPQGPCHLDIEVCCPIPKEWDQSEKNRAWANSIWPIDGADLLAIEAIIMPALRGTSIVQVVKRKRYSNVPRIVVCLTQV